MLRRRFMQRKPDERWDFVWTPNMGNLDQYGFVKRLNGGGKTVEYTEKFLKLHNDNSINDQYIGYAFPFASIDYGAVEMDVCIIGNVSNDNGFRALISNGTDGSQLVIRHNLNNGYCWLCTETTLNDNRIADFPLDGNYHTIRATISPEYSNYWLDGVQVGVNLPHSTWYAAKSWFLSQGLAGDVLIRSIKYRVGE